MKIIVKSLKHWWQENSPDKIDSNELNGLVFFAGDKPIIQLHLFKNRGKLSETKAVSGPNQLRRKRFRYSGQYTIFWEARTAVSRAVVIARDLAKVLPGNIYHNSSEPIIAHYSYIPNSGMSFLTGPQKTQKQTLLVYPDPTNLSLCNQQLASIHGNFINAEQAVMGFIYRPIHDANHDGYFIMSGDCMSFHPDSESELVFSLNAPVFPLDFFKSVFQETALNRIGDKDLQTILEIAMRKVSKFSEGL